jgi:hypothetical protein
MALPRSLVLCGLGPHARRIHYPMVERHAATHGAELALLVELEDQRETVERYLAGRTLQPRRIVYLPSSERHGDRLHPAFLAAVAEAAQDGLWGAVIACEPKSHLIYARWAAEHGLHVLLDKPVTAFDIYDAQPADALRLVDEYFELLSLARDAGTTFLVQAQRRAHTGYQMIHAYLERFLAEFEVPITYLDVYHSDGMWNMPNEFLVRENHPYRYGYGKLMHSGYHFLDLFSWFMSLNDRVPGCAPDRLDLVTKHVRPSDLLTQIDLGVYDSFFGNGDALASLLGDDVVDDMRRFGETDVFLLAQFARDDAVVATGALNLLQTSFSRRAWPELPEDTYKGNGRVRHERVTIQVGPLLSVQVHSYQSYEAKDRGRVDGRAAGHYDHFDILFFRNSQLVGGQPFEEVKLGEKLLHDYAGDAGYLGHNEAAREEIFLDFLAGRDDRAGLHHHELPIKLTAAAYYAMLAANRGLVSLPQLDLRSAGEDDWLTDLALQTVALA